MLSDEAVFMVYLQLCEFRLPACGCSWKTVSKTFCVPQPLVISWSSDIPAQCNQPQVCLSLFILTEWEQSIEGELLIVWDHWLFFQVCSTSQAVGDITHHRPSFSSSLAAIRMKCPLKSTKALKWAIWKAYVSHDRFFFLQMDRHQTLIFFHCGAVCFSLQIPRYLPVGLWTLYGPFFPPDNCLFFLVTFHWEASYGSKETTDHMLKIADEPSLVEEWATLQQGTIWSAGSQWCLSSWLKYFS